jgi:chromate transport protein ChrA
VHDVADFNATEQSVNLRTTGRDPFIETAFTPKKAAESVTLRPHYLLWSVTLTLIFVFLLRLRKEPLDEGLQIRLILYGLFLFFLLFKGWYYKEKIRFGYPPDEGAHLSYIAHIHKEHRFFVRFEDMRMLNNKNAGNYLSHPPLYYELAHLAYDPTKSFKENAKNFREVSFALYALAVVLLLYLGFGAPLQALGHFVYLATISSIPMFSYIGGSISNDTLSYLAAAIFFIALYRLLQNQNDHKAQVALIFSALLAYFSKLTAALLIFFALIFYFFYATKTRSMPRLTKWIAALLLLAAIPVVLYQGYIIIHYHAIIPTFNHTHPEQYLNSPFYVPEPYRQHLSPVEWGVRLWHYIVGGWFGIHSHHSFVKESLGDYWGVLILHLFAIASLFLPCPSDKKAFCLLGKITLTALFAVLVIQYLFSYKAHLSSGYMGGLQPRYLLPFLASFAIMSSIFVERFKKNFWWNVAVIAIAIHAIYSDFFYFLLYYR